MTVLTLLVLLVSLFQESYLRDIEEFPSLRFCQAPTEQRPQLTNKQTNMKHTQTFSCVTKIYRDCSEDAAHTMDSKLHFSFI